ncbi:MAG: zinc ribbon domain-containing protein [Methanomassiliicoccales archaeon]|nr:zinc ribbon domain-containing protein [Methanomassiliicoccales archaeon]
MARFERNAQSRFRHGKLPGPRVPSGLILGVFLAVIGGALIVVSTYFPWVQLVGHVPVVNLKILDVVDANGTYQVMYLIPFSGILVALFSVMAVFGGTRGWGPTWLWPTTTIVCMMLSTIAVILSLALLNNDYMAATAEEAKFGSAAFVAAFGLVLVVAGSVIMMLGHKAHWESRQIIKSSRMKPPALTKTRVKQLPPQGPKLQERCPKCNSPVESDWRTCPICGEKL